MPSEYRSVQELAQSPWNDGVCSQTGFDQGDHWQLHDRVGSAQHVSLATSTQMMFKIGLYHVVRMDIRFF